MITVVVCTHNGARKIPATLAALEVQDSLEYEVIVVDDGSSDGVGAVVQHYVDNRGFVYIRSETNIGLSAARNLGILAARGEIVAFCDDDCVPGRNWISELMEAWNWAGSSVRGIGGSVVAHSRDTLARRYAQATRPLAPIERTMGGGVGGRLAAYLRGVPRGGSARPVLSLVGANMSYRREAIETVGGFDELIRFGGDEEKLCERLRTHYGEDCLWFEPEIVMGHEYEPSIKDTFRRARAYGRGSGREWARNGGMPSLRPGIIAISGISVLGLLAGVVGASWAVVGGIWAGVLLIGPVVLARHTIDGENAEKYLYPYLTLALEGANLVGFFNGWRVWRRTAAVR